jgi:uncharacterized protein (TIGR04255 family)
VGKILKNKPLVEVIFELHWELPETTSSGEKFDPDYRRFLARMEERITDDYRKYKPLPAADIPEKLIPHMVQHQFWTADNAWPVIQVGPGIVAVNDTAGYHWLDFKERISYLVESFFKAHPHSDKVNFRKTLLKYINARKLDYEQADVLAFLKDKLKVNIDVAQIMSQDPRVNATPYALNLVTVFLSHNPKGSIEIKVRRGKIHDDDVLFWELTSFAIGGNVPGPEQQDIVAWSEDAHILIRGLFFKMVSGELLKEFE